MKNTCAALALLVALWGACSPAQAADDAMKRMVAAYAMDYPDQAITLAPLLLRGDGLAAVSAATDYLEGAMCDKADYWLEQVRAASESEYAEMTATAQFNGHCRERNQEAALQSLQQCFSESLSCGRKLLEGAQMLDKGELALQTAKQLAAWGDETGLNEWYFFSVNGMYSPSSPEEAYYLGLLAMRVVADPELRNVFVATNASLGNKLSEEKKQQILARANAWKPEPLPENMEEHSLSSGMYPLR